MFGLLGCLAGCLSRKDAVATDLCEASYEKPVSNGSSTVIAGDWQTVPDDVLQAVSNYLFPVDAAAARLTCRRWRRTLSCYIQHLSIPTRYLSTKGARQVLRRAGLVFPNARHVTLYHADGWCDPVQARMDLEPLVRLESRSVTVQPLSVTFPQITKVTLCDATFTRDPWPLSHLAWLSGLRGLELAWDTALWAPGQIMQEEQAMQGIFNLHQLSELVLQKNAHLFLGEVCLSDATLAAAAAGLRNLVRLDLSTVRVQDDGFAALGLLRHLTHLSLRGQLNVTIEVLGQVFLHISKLEELNLGLLVPSSNDLRRIAAAHSHAGSSTHRGGPAIAAASSSSRQQRRRSSIVPAGSSSSSMGWRSAFPTAAAAAAAAGSSTVISAPPGNARCDNSTSSSSSSSGPWFYGSDWTAVFTPLRRLRKLHLQSDLVLLGSCNALRNLPSLSHLELHGGAKFLHTWHCEDLPRSWISELAAAAAVIGDNARSVVTAASSSNACPAAAAADYVLMQGAWPALKSLHIDNVQAFDVVISAVARLLSLRTLIISGPCLLAFEQQQPPVAAAAMQQQQQQQHVEVYYMMTHNVVTTALSPSSSSSRGSSSGAVSIKHQQQQQQQRQRQRRSTDCYFQSASLRSLSGLSQSPQPPEFWSYHHQHQQNKTAASSSAAAAAATKRSGSSFGHSSSSGSSTLGSSNSNQLGLSALGSHSPLPPLPAAAAAAAVNDDDSILARDADLLTCLSPLKDLQCFHLHSPHKMPDGLSMTPFCLAHLAPSWTQLTSLDIDITPPAAAAAAAAARNAGAGQHTAAAAADSSGMAQVVQGLSGYTSLQDLTLRLSGDVDECCEVDDARGNSSSSSSGGHSRSPPCCWSHLPVSLISISLHNARLNAQDLLEMGAATPQLRHLRLLQCNISDADLWYLPKAWPSLQTLVITEAPYAGISTSGVAAVAGFSHLRVLGLTLEPLTDVSSLKHLTGLRYLLLDGRSNLELNGVKALCSLKHLKHLILPLLHLHHSEKSSLAALQSSLPNTVISNITSNHGHYHGYQWYKNFTLRERQWWREPEVPWKWYPTLCISP